MNTAKLSSEVLFQMIRTLSSNSWDLTDVYGQEEYSIFLECLNELEKRAGAKVEAKP